ncbi:MAG: hypothetical protein ABSE18_02425 [Minisyncoccia bacterium]|jgi:hypothetical protein
MTEEQERQTKRVRRATWIFIAIAAALSVFLYLKNLPPPNGTYDAFAKCIASTTTKFYGAFWCSHCEDQKREFGNAAQYLPYIECSTPDGSGETKACQDAGITEYPTWYFPDGSSSTGVQSPQMLSQKTGCPLSMSTP